jgi:hypothetical protein
MAWRVTMVAAGKSYDHVLHVIFDIVMRCRSVRDDACYGMNDGSSSSKEFDEGGSVKLSALDTAQGTAEKPFVIDDDDDDDDDDDKTALDLSMPSAARPLLFKAAA